MFRRLDAFAKKVSDSTKKKQQAARDQSTNSSNSSSLASSLTYETDSHAHVDTDDLDMSLLIGPNKGKTAAQIIDELDPRYFDATFDPLEELLTAMGSNWGEHDGLLEGKLNELDVVKLCIDKRLSQQVFANYNHFVDGLSLIGHIKDDLFETSLLCSDGRARLSAVSRELTVSILSTLQYSQRTARLTTVQMHLADIAQLLRKEKEILLLLKEGEFTSAVNVYKECLGRLAQSGMNKFTCLEDVRKRFLRSAESINARAKEQLAAQCKKFNLQQCGNVVDALISLGEVQVLSELLRKHYPVVVDEVSVNSVLPYLDHERMANAGDVGDIRSKRFKELASLLDMTRFGACYLTLTSNFTDILSSCIRMEQYLDTVIEQHHESDSTQSALTQARDFLNVYRQELWSQVQQSTITLLSSVQLTTQTIHPDDFLRLLHAGFTFIGVGETFARTNSDGLRGALFRKAKEYVRLFARESFDELKTALGKEQWKALKTSRAFSMADLPELRGRELQGQWAKESEAEEHKESVANGVERKEESDEVSKPSTDAADGADSSTSGVYEAFLRGDNPFRATLQVQLLEYEKREQEKQMERERGKYYRLQSGIEYKPTSKLLDSRAMQSSLQHASLLTAHTNADIGVVLTSSSLLAARYVGRYISVMEDVKPLSMESFSYLQELFELYVYAIFCFFGPEQREFFTDYYDNHPNLKKLVQSVKQKVEQGTFGAGIFQSFAVPRASVIADTHTSPAPSPQAASSSSSGSSSSGGGGGFGSSGFLGSAGKDKERDRDGGKEKGLLGGFNKLSKTLNQQVDRMGSGLQQIGNLGSGQKSDSKPAATVTSSAAVREEKRGHPVLIALNNRIDVNDPHRMYAVTERCIAIESLPFLLDIIRGSHRRMLAQLRPSEQASVQQWTDFAARVIADLHDYMYKNLAPVMLPESVYAPKIKNMDWYIRSEATQASPYVFSILTTLRANTLCMKDNGGLPADTQARLNRETVAWLEESLVRAYSEVKRCSEEGRRLMRLDVESMEGSLKGLLRLDEVDGWEKVRVYVEAYWVKADEWLEWVRAHREYTLSEVVSCIQCGCGAEMDMKELKTLLSSVSREVMRLEEEDRERKYEEQQKTKEELKQQG